MDTDPGIKSPDTGLHPRERKSCTWICPPSDSTHAAVTHSGRPTRVISTPSSTGPNQGRDIGDSSVTGANESEGFNPDCPPLETLKGTALAGSMPAPTTSPPTHSTAPWTDAPPSDRTGDTNPPDATAQIRRSGSNAGLSSVPEVSPEAFPSVEPPGKHCDVTTMANTGALGYFSGTSYVTNRPSSCATTTDRPLAPSH